MNHTKPGFVTRALSFPGCTEVERALTAWVTLMAVLPPRSSISTMERGLEEGGMGLHKTGLSVQWERDQPWKHDAEQKTQLEEATQQNRTAQNQTLLGSPLSSNSHQLFFDTMSVVVVVVAGIIMVVAATAVAGGGPAVCTIESPKVRTGSQAALKASVPSGFSVNNHGNARPLSTDQSDFCL